MMDRAKAALAAIAAREGISLAEVESAIQEAIDAAWDNPEGREAQLQLFPGGKPTPAEFIAAVAAILPSEAGEGFGGGPVRPQWLS